MSILVRIPLCQVVAAASAGLLSIGLFAILQELRAHGDAFKSSLLLLCDDILKQSDCGAVRLDSACKALVSDILR